MARKRWTPQEEVTLSLLNSREKRKWQINLRRYVVEQSPCPPYAPYFGLDIQNMRKWFEFQFKNGETWENYGKIWQFEHVIPVTCFDFTDEAELKICWNFTNLRVEHSHKNNDGGSRLDILGAKRYFKDLHEKTLYKPCLNLLEKIDRLEISEIISTEAQETFIKEHRPFLDMIENYSVFEFELLNSGRSIEEVKKEIDFIKKFEK